MKSKIMRSEEETLLPSSLLEEENNSNNESDSSINFNRNLSLFNEDKDDDYPNQVNIINNNFNFMINIGRKGRKRKKIGFIIWTKDQYKRRKLCRK